MKTENLGARKQALRKAMQIPSDMPDIAAEVKGQLQGKIDRVGMSEIELPITFKNTQGALMQAPAMADAFVSLDDPKAKGIHMSRLFLESQETLSSRELNFELIEEVLRGFLQSHSGLSRSAYFKVQYDYMTQRPALKSKNLGWRKYPVAMAGFVSKNQAGELSFQFELKTRITYSSTCPCSAALSRQLVQKAFAEEFSERQLNFEAVHEWLGTPAGMPATPHSQRSYADVKLRFTSASQSPSVDSIIDTLEDALATPVQAAVKREDEQEFARLNGQNLMFCEDAARKIFHTLDENSKIQDFWARVDHVESLHAHNATSVITKGIEGGYQA